jgi:hypothetical protein
VGRGDWRYAEKGAWTYMPGRPPIRDLVDLMPPSWEVLGDSLSAWAVWRLGDPGPNRIDASYLCQYRPDEHFYVWWEPGRKRGTPLRRPEYLGHFGSAEDVHETVSWHRQVQAGLGEFGKRNPDPKRVYQALLKRIEPKANCAPAEVAMALRKMATLEEKYGEDYLRGLAPSKKGAPRPKPAKPAESAQAKAKRDKSRREAKRRALRRQEEERRRKAREAREEAKRRREESRAAAADRTWERTEGRRHAQEQAERRRQGARQEAKRRRSQLKTAPVMSWTEFWKHRCEEWKWLKDDTPEMNRQMKALRRGLEAHPPRTAEAGSGWHFRLPDPFGHYPFKRRVLCGFVPRSNTGDVREYVIAQLGLDLFTPVDVWPAGTEEPPLIFTQKNPLLKPKRTFGLAYTQWELRDYPLQLVIADLTEPNLPVLVAGGTIDMNKDFDYEASMMAAARGYGPLLYDAAATLLDEPLVPSKIRSAAAVRFWARQDGKVQPLTKAEWGIKYRNSLEELVRRGKGISTTDFLALLDDAEELAADASEGEALGIPVQTPWEEEMSWTKAQKPRKARKPRRAKSNPLDPDFPPIREYRDLDVYDPRDEAIRAVVRGADRSGAVSPWGIGRGKYLREHSVGETIERSYERYQDVDRLIRGRQEYEIMLGRGRKYGPFRATLEPTRQGLRFFVWPLTPKSRYLPVGFSSQGAADSYIRGLLNEGIDPTRDLGTLRARKYRQADLRDWLPPESAFQGRSGNPTRVKLREEKKKWVKPPPPPPTPKQRKPKKVKPKVRPTKPPYQLDPNFDWDAFFRGDKG